MTMKKMVMDNNHHHHHHLLLLLLILSPSTFLNEVHASTATATATNGSIIPQPFSNKKAFLKHHFRGNHFNKLQQKDFIYKLRGGDETKSSTEIMNEDTDTDIDTDTDTPVSVNEEELEQQLQETMEESKERKTIRDIMEGESDNTPSSTATTTTATIEVEDTSEDESDDYSDDENEETEENEINNETLDETDSTTIQENINDVDVDVDVDVDESTQDTVGTSDTTVETTTTASSTSQLSSSSFQSVMGLKQEEALDLRTKGKQLHDECEFQSAAMTFSKAATELDDIISCYKEQIIRNKNDEDDDENDEDDENDIEDELVKLSEERATCRLHEALCHLKDKNYALSIQSCTDVLMDSVQVVALTNDDDDDDDDKEADDEEDASDSHAVIVRISPSNNEHERDNSSAAKLSPAVRARAYHRRAKARLALGDATGALDDARSAAFLGDRNAVALYGKLMRDGSDGGGGGGLGGVLDGFGSGDLSSLFSSASSSPSPLQSLFSNNSSSDNNDESDPSSFDFFSSMLNSQSNDSSSGSANPFGALGGLGSMLDPNSFGGASDGHNTGINSLAKSLLLSVTKRIEDKSTQEMVCNYLNDVDASQISSLSAMAGVPLSSSIIDRIVRFANGVTPKGMRRVIKLLKRLIFMGNILRKVFQVIGKYKHLIVVVFIIAWIKSAILRPVVVKTKSVKGAADAMMSQATSFIV